MRTVERDRFVAATPQRVQRVLTPRAIVEAEGSFDVHEVREEDGTTIVIAGAKGVTLPLRFELRDDGFYYTQAGEGGPFEEMDTWVTVTPENEGSRVQVRSEVSLGLPLPGVTDRIAAWKRRGELKRLLRTIEDLV